MSEIKQEIEKRIDNSHKLLEFDEDDVFITKTISTSNTKKLYTNFSNLFNAKLPLPLLKLTINIMILFGIVAIYNYFIADAILYTYIQFGLSVITLLFSVIFFINLYLIGFGFSTYKSIFSLKENWIIYLLSSLIIVSLFYFIIIEINIESVMDNGSLILFFFLYIILTPILTQVHHHSNIKDKITEPTPKKIKNTYLIKEDSIYSLINVIHTVEDNKEKRYLVVKKSINTLFEEKSNDEINKILNITDEERKILEDIKKQAENPYNLSEKDLRKLEKNNLVEEYFKLYT